MLKRQKRGIMLVSAIVISLVMMMWVVAAIYQTKHQSNLLLQSHQKSKAYYLAKTAASYSLFYINADPGWPAAHSSRDAAWTGIADARCWVSSGDSGPTLLCEAKVEGQTHTLRSPRLQVDNKGTKLLSVTTTVDGHSAIAQNSLLADGWDSLPPIPGMPRVRSATGADNGDIYAVTDRSGKGSLLWRYRPGRGWAELPDLPSGTNIQEVSIAKSERLVARGSDDVLVVLPLDSDLKWQSYKAPEGTKLDRVSIPCGNSSAAFASASNGSGPTVLKFTFSKSGGDWQELSAPPVAVRYNPTNGEPLTPFSGNVTNFDGGIGANDQGDVYVASNIPDEPSVIYKRKSDGEWQAFPAIQFHQWKGEDIDFEGFATVVKDLRVDDQGDVWVQAQAPDSTTFSNLRLDDG